MHIFAHTLPAVVERPDVALALAVVAGVAVAWLLLSLVDHIRDVFRAAAGQHADEQLDAVADAVGVLVDRVEQSPADRVAQLAVAAGGAR